MEIKTIFRVEDRTGCGMFRSDLNPVRNFCRDIHNRHSSFNTPDEDGLYIKDNEFCAYKSLDHIKQWILKDEFELLVAYGFKIYEIGVKKWREGRDNVLFQNKHIMFKKDITKAFL